MDSALLIITEKLKQTGMSTVEVDYLLARFLQEEAFDYVRYIETELDEYKYDEGTIFCTPKEQRFS